MICIQVKNTTLLYVKTITWLHEDQTLNIQNFYGYSLLQK